MNSIAAKLQLLVLADDLTGAAEVGAIFAERGLSTVVTTETTVSLAAVENTTLVVDTESRHLPPAEAGARVSTLSSAAIAHGVPLIYKKTDSTLRGNIGAELCALRSSEPNQLLFYIPAYPEMGRTVRAGRLYVDGTPVSDSAFGFDTLNPVKSSYIPDVLRRGSCEPVFLVRSTDISSATLPGIYVCDGETDEDLQQAARSLLARGGRTLAAGPAGLAKSIARLISSAPAAAPPMPNLERCLVVNGSMHEQSRRQIDYAKSHGWSLFNPLEIAQSFFTKEWRILQPQTGGHKPAAEFAANIGDLVSRAVRGSRLDGLIIFGGDTAHAILSALGESRMDSVAEILPGVPLSRIGFEGRNLYVVTKAGGFGPLDVLPRIRDRVGA